MLCLWVLFVCAGPVGAYSFQTPGEVPPVQFRKMQVASESFESAGVFDVNDDGHLDIVSGAFWYGGPDFRDRHYIRDVDNVGEYWDEFATIPMDVNGDGHTDYVTGGWFGKNIKWHQNPGEATEWKEHIIDETGNVETIRSWDVDGDGYREIVPNNPNDPLKFYTLNRDDGGEAVGTFKKVAVADRQDHGLGFGDINGDGRGDFIVSNGWLEAPVEPESGKWIRHEEFSLGDASIPILVVDVNADGRNDLIVGQAHSYGLDWYEQEVKKTGERAWVRHPIDPHNSQFHTMEWVDIDGDGRNELVTGKRYRAHNGNDPGGDDPVGLYYYKWNGEAFVKNTISYGPLGEGKGAGIYFEVVDLGKDGWKDIVVAGKDGLYVFFNEGNRY
ncbi:Repeat domain-containing protein [Fodinibius sediminis]|uniref:Repeat domain-containing protein n=2 Tax=Fodinibius sediminis TaxID=1214077 RepID=A0A521BPL1_9BACT|nr:Repeat domain-containing protein [Fodinibius sediminis]